LKLIKSKFNTDNFIRRLSCFISGHFVAFHSWKNCQKIIETPYFWLKIV